MAEAKDTTKKASATVKKTASASKSASTAKKAPAKTEAKKAPAKVAAKKPVAASANKTGKVKSESTKKAAQESAGGLLKLHHLKPAEGAHKSKTRVGRGEASKGKTAGRGTKGTKARYQVHIGFEGGQMPMHMRLPKLRGFKNPFRVEFQVVNLNRLEKIFPKGGKVTVEDLVLKGLVRDMSPVKLLGEGEVTQKFEITVDRASKSAIAAVEKAGGTVTMTGKTKDEIKAENKADHETKTKAAAKVRNARS
jgi:large subunit ribosomal protein L15